MFFSIRSNYYFLKFSLAHLPRSLGIIGTGIHCRVHSNRHLWRFDDIVAVVHRYLINVDTITFYFIIIK